MFTCNGTVHDENGAIMVIFNMRANVDNRLVIEFLTEKKKKKKKKNTTILHGILQ